MSNPLVPAKSTGDQLSAGEVNSIVSSIGTKEDAVNKGVANGYAGLDGSAKIPAAQLPSYVDDVLEYSNVAAFPSPGETGKIYVDLSTNPSGIYRWSGSVYIPIGGSGSSLTPTAIKTANYNALSGDFVPVNNAAGNLTVTLPAAPADKAQVGVKLVLQTGVNTVIVNTAGSDVFNKAGGSTSLTLTLLNQGALFQYNASAGIWYVIADDLPLGLLATAAALATGLAGKIDTAAVDSSVLLKPELGVLFSDNFDRTSGIGSNWTSTGVSTYSIVSNKLQIVSSIGSYTPLASYLLYTGYSKSQVESFTVTMDIVPGTLSATSFGVGLILKGGGTYPATSAITLRLDTGSNLGKIQFDDASGATVLGAKGITISAGDNISLIFRYIKNKHIVTVNNKTTGASCTTEYVINTSYSTVAQVSLPSTYQFGITAPGGTHTIDNFVVTSNDLKTVDILFDGDSILHGFYTDNFMNRAIELINANSNTVTQAHAGAGSATIEVNVAEVVALAPKKLVLQKVINDMGSDVSDTSVQTKYATYVAAFVSAGYVLGTTLFLTVPFPHNTLQSRVNTFITWQKANYPASALIDCNTPFVNSATGNTYDPNYSFDGVHLNNTGNVILADTFINFFNLPSKPKKIGDYLPLMQGANGFYLMASQFLKGVAPRSLLHLMGTGTTLQLNDGNNDSGLFMQGGGNNFSMASNLKNNGSVDLATGAAGIKISTNGTIYQAQYFTGATVGATPSLSNFWYCSGGQTKFGSPNIGPKAIVHIANSGGAANGAALKIDPGALMAVTEAGAIEPTTTHIYYTPVAAGPRFQLDQQLAVLVSKTVNYTALVTDYTILVDATSGNLTITVNPALTNMLNIKKIDATANTVTIVPSTGTIEGAASVVLSAQYAFKRVQGNGGSVVMVF